MKIGVVVDGVSEFRSIAALYTQLEGLGDSQMLRPLQAPIAPLAPPGVIAKQCSSRISQLIGRGAERIVVLFDRETREGCSGEIAASVERLIRSPACDVRVVIKDRMFENWLIADVGAVAKVTGRFDVSSAMVKQVEPDKADRANALGLLKKAAAKHAAYDKVKDSKRILEKADVVTMAENSRSFRRFLRCLECEKYRNQSRRAV